MKIQGWSVAGKAWVALIGSLLTFIVPTLLAASASWPAPWPAVLGAVVAVLTALGVYRAPYQPTTTHHSDKPRSTPWPTS